jgi:hypothetical protein
VGKPAWMTRCILGWFGDAEALRRAHQIETSERNIATLVLDDFE